MNESEMKNRTKAFGIEVIRLTDLFPNSRTIDIISRQLIRSALSVGANYRSACRGKSKPDFISKISIAAEEADESQYWLEILAETGLASSDKIRPLLQEANELTAMLTATIKTARNRTTPPAKETADGRRSKI